MRKITELFITPDTSLLDVLSKMDGKGANSAVPKGVVIVVNQKEQLLGTVTDGDVRRAILEHKSLDIPASYFMQKDPICFQENYSLQDILEQLPAKLVEKGRKSKTFLSKIILTDDQNRPVRILEYHELWEQRIATHRKIVVIGLGYVGLTLALVLADRGFTIQGVELDENKIKQLNEGQSYVHELGLPEILRERIHKNFHVTHEVPSDGDVFVISVGTPVRMEPGSASPSPILSQLSNSLKMIAQKLKPGNLVILRSTVPVGTCRDFVIPQLEKLTGMRCGLDFHLSFAPERTAEGKAIKELRELPQIIGGYNQDSVEATAAIFKELTNTIVRVNSLEEAEMVKLINNSFRDYIFAYANFLAKVATPYNIDIVKVIQAANKGYPRDRVPLPSPGVGGPCLTKDPYIFSKATEDQNIEDLVFRNSRRINEEMPVFIVHRILSTLKMLGKKVEKSQILVCGLAFKGYPETGDIRNSSSIEVLKLLKSKGAIVKGYDPVASEEDMRDEGVQFVSLPKGFSKQDVVLFLNNHKSFEKIDVFEMVRSMSTSPIVLDGWNLFHEEDVLRSKPSIYMSLSHSVNSLKPENT
jgi:nucleotide sugar dehydrogenase